MFYFFFYFIIAIIIVINIFLAIGIFSFFKGALYGAPFVPTRKKIMEKMMELAGNMKNKNIYDLGCGDGRLVFAASEKKANAIGLEISYPVYFLALARKFFTHSSGEIKHKSLWDENLENADVIFLYLLPKMMKKFEQEKIPTLKKGCKIISNGFSFPNIKPIQEIKISSLQGRVLVYEI